MSLPPHRIPEPNGLTVRNYQHIKMIDLQRSDNLSAAFGYAIRRLAMNFP